MAGDFVETTLGCLLSFANGRSSPERADGLPYPVYGSNGVIGHAADANSEAGSIVIGRVGSYCGSLYLSDEKCWVTDNAIRAKALEHNDSRFLFYLLETLGLNNWRAGSGQPLLNQDILSRIPAAVPESEEQRAIAHILGALDNKIELNRRTSATLEAMARALFKSWFVDFDPVRAKLEGRWQRGQSLPGLPAHLYDLFPDRLVDSELGEIPVGWQLEPLSAWVEINPSRSIKKRSAAPYLDMANMPTAGHSPDRVISRAFGSGMKFINGDTLLARITPCLENGKTAFVDFLDDGQVGWGSTEYIVLRPKPPLPEEFAYCLARSSGFRDFAIQSMTGSSGRQRVPADALAGFPIAVPDAPVADAFGHAAKAWFARASEATRESRTLAALRDTLLPKLISGELRVPDAERFVAAAGVRTLEGQVDIDPAYDDKALRQRPVAE